MIVMLFNLAGFSSRTRSVWILPVFMLILLFLTRAASFVSANLYTLYFVYYSCLGIAFILSFAFMAGSLNALFIHGHDLKSEVIFFKKLGHGTVDQFIMKLFVVALSTLFLWSLCSFIIWHFSYRLLIVMTVIYSMLLMLKTASLALKTSLVYYVAAVIFLLSLFYPVYILPNPAYLLKGGVREIAYYSIIYVLLYLIVGYKFFISSWRKECIGWMF